MREGRAPEPESPSSDPWAHYKSILPRGQGNAAERGNRNMPENPDTNRGRSSESTGGWKTRSARYAGEEKDPSKGSENRRTRDTGKRPAKSDFSEDLEDRSFQTSRAQYKSILPRGNGAFQSRSSRKNGAGGELSWESGETGRRAAQRDPEYERTGRRASGRAYPEGERTGRSGRRNAEYERTGRAAQGDPEYERTGRRASGRAYPEDERTGRSGRRNAEYERAGRPRTAGERTNGHRSAEDGQNARRDGEASRKYFPKDRRPKPPKGWKYILYFYKGYFLYPLFFLYFEIMLRLLSGNGWFSHPGYVFYFAIAAGLIVGGLTMLIPRRQRRVVNLVILTAVGVYFAIECVLHSVYINYMSPTNILSEGGNVAGKYSGEMFRGILFGIPKGLLFILPPIVVFRLARLRARKKPYPILAAIAFVVLGFVGTMLTANAAAAGPQRATYTAQFAFTRATDTFGLLTSTRLSLRNALFGNPHSDFHEEGTPEATPQPTFGGTDVSADTREEAPSAPTPVSAAGDKNEMAIDFGAVSGNDAVRNLTEYVRARTASSKNAYTGLFKGKNLIMIAAESYAGCFITPELTPTLWRMTHNGFYFSDYYQVEWGGSTTTGEMSIMIGIAPQWGDESMINSSKNNNYFTMGNQLQRLGYSSIALHNGSSDYYQRQTTHLNLGYNQWVANDTGVGDLCGRGWPTDTEMFEKTIPLYVNHSPFNVYYMTLSGHAPYNDPENELVKKHYDRVNAAVGDKYQETTKHYICYQMELEESMKFLIHELEEAGIADDTVIMIVGDHYPYGLGAGEAWGNDQNYITDLLKTEVTPSWNRDRNNLIIWSECLEHGLSDYACEISTPMFNLDILPTLSNLFGLTYDSRLMPGRDVFSDASPLVFWDTRDWITDKGRYLAISDTYMPNEGEAYDEAYFREISRQVENKLLFSRVVVENDYYGLLFGPDTVTLAGDILYPGGGETARPYAAG